MAPLPCSPVSNSTASESHATSEDSDASLNTPRPGPADPAQRTEATLSRPTLLPTSTSLPPTHRSSNRSSEPVSPLTKPATDHPAQPGSHPQLDPSTSGSSPRIPALASISELEPLERRRSITFGAQTAAPKSARHSSYGSFVMTGARSPPISPWMSPRQRLIRESEDMGDSSADENTAIMKKTAPGGGGQSYGAMADNEDSEPDEPLASHDGAAEFPARLNRRRNGSLRTKGNRNAHPASEREEDDSEHESWFKALLDKYGSVELENKGSVARDHLALERTFLAWLRTSLSFASIGIAVTQLFRLNTALQPSNPNSASDVEPYSNTARLRQVGKPLGATFLGISILILLLGFHRFFESQHYVIRGKFPASRVTIILVSFVAFALIVASLIVIVAVAPSAFEK